MDEKLTKFGRYKFGFKRRWSGRQWYIWWRNKREDSRNKLLEWTKPWRVVLFVVDGKWRLHGCRRGADPVGRSAEQLRRQRSGKDEDITEGFIENQPVGQWYHPCPYFPPFFPKHHLSLWLGGNTKCVLWTIEESVLTSGENGFLQLVWKFETVGVLAMCP